MNANISFENFKQLALNYDSLSSNDKAIDFRLYGIGNGELSQIKEYYDLRDIMSTYNNKTNLNKVNHHISEEEFNTQFNKDKGKLRKELEEKQELSNWLDKNSAKWININDTFLKQNNLEIHIPSDFTKYPKNDVIQKLFIPILLNYYYLSFERQYKATKEFTDNYDNNPEESFRILENAIESTGKKESEFRTELQNAWNEVAGYLGARSTDRFDYNKYRGDYKTPKEAATKMRLEGLEREYIKLFGYNYKIPSKDPYNNFQKDDDKIEYLKQKIDDYNDKNDIIQSSEFQAEFGKYIYNYQNRNDTAEKLLIKNDLDVDKTADYIKLENLKKEFFDLFHISYDECEEEIKQKKKSRSEFKYISKNGGNSSKEKATTKNNNQTRTDKVRIQEIQDILGYYNDYITDYDLQAVINDYCYTIGTNNFPYLEYIIKYWNDGSRMWNDLTFKILQVKILQKNNKFDFSKYTATPGDLEKLSQILDDLTLKDGWWESVDAYNLYSNYQSEVGTSKSLMDIKIECEGDTGKGYNKMMTDYYNHALFNKYGVPLETITNYTDEKRRELETKFNSKESEGAIFTEDNFLKEKLTIYQNTHGIVDTGKIVRDKKGDFDEARAELYYMMASDLYSENLETLPKRGNNVKTYIAELKKKIENYYLRQNEFNNNQDLKNQYNSFAGKIPYKFEDLIALFDTNNPTYDKINCLKYMEACHYHSELYNLKSKMGEKVGNAQLEFVKDKKYIEEADRLKREYDSAKKRYDNLTNNETYKTEVAKYNGYYPENIINDYGELLDRFGKNVSEAYMKLKLANRKYEFRNKHKIEYQPKNKTEKEQLVELETIEEYLPKYESNQNFNNALAEYNIVFKDTPKKAIDYVIEFKERIDAAINKMTYDYRKEKLSRLKQNTEKYNNNDDDLDEMKNVLEIEDKIKAEFTSNTDFNTAFENYNKKFTGIGKKLTTRQVMQLYKTAENSIKALNTLVNAKILEEEYEVPFDYNTVEKELQKNIKITHSNYSDKLDTYNKEYQKFENIPGITQKVSKYASMKSLNLTVKKFFNKFGRNADEAYCYLILDEYNRKYPKSPKKEEDIKKATNKESFRKDLESLIEKYDRIHNI